MATDNKPIGVPALNYDAPTPKQREERELEDKVLAHTELCCTPGCHSDSRCEGCRDDARAIIQAVRTHSPEEPVGWQPMEDAPRDGSDIIAYRAANPRVDRDESFLRLRWSTHYSIHGLGGCWTDGLCTMSDMDFAGWVPAPIGQPLDGSDWIDE